jgi:hypothetical protein
MPTRISEMQKSSSAAVLPSVGLLTHLSWLAELFSPVFLLRRWRLLVKTIPFIGISCFIRWMIWHDNFNESPSETFVLAPLITACVFVTSSMLSNVVSDFKESEKIPAELVGYFQTLLTFAISASRHAKHHRLKHPHQYIGEKPIHVGEALRHIESILLSIIDFLDGRRTYLEVSQTQLDAEIDYITLMATWGFEAMETPEHCLTEIRKKMCRMHDIARTHIILPLYTLIDVLTICLISYITTIKFTYENTAYACLVFFGGLFIYLNFLNRDLDDPFQYPPGYHLATYLSGIPDRLKIEEAWSNPPAIDFNCLTADFGLQLRKYMSDVNMKPSRVNMAIEKLRTEEGSKSLGALQRQFSFLRSSLRITNNPLSSLSLELNTSVNGADGSKNDSSNDQHITHKSKEEQTEVVQLHSMSTLENIEEDDEQEANATTENFYGNEFNLVEARNSVSLSSNIVETWHSKRFAGGQTLS